MRINETEIDFFSKFADDNIVTDNIKTFFLLSRNGKFTSKLINISAIFHHPAAPQNNIQIL